MSEHNKLKDRRCNTCGAVIHGKASKLKKHGKEHVQGHRAAAAEAIMEKLKNEMQDDALLESAPVMESITNDESIQGD